MCSFNKQLHSFSDLILTDYFLLRSPLLTGRHEARRERDALWGRSGTRLLLGRQCPPLDPLCLLSDRRGTSRGFKDWC